MYWKNIGKMDQKSWENEVKTSQKMKQNLCKNALKYAPQIRHFFMKKSAARFWKSVGHIFQNHEIVLVFIAYYAWALCRVDAPSDQRGIEKTMPTSMKSYTFSVPKAMEKTWKNRRRIDNEKASNYGAKMEQNVIKKGDKNKSKTSSKKWLIFSWILRSKWLNMEPKWSPFRTMLDHFGSKRGGPSYTPGGVLK